MTDCQACDRPVNDAYLCGPCRDELRQLLTKLPSWLSHLAESATGQARLGGDGGRRTHRNAHALDGEALVENYHGPALLTQFLRAGGVNARASERLQQIHNSLTTIVRDLCEHRGLTWWPPRMVIPGFIGPLPHGWRRMHRNYRATSADLARWLSGHVDAIAAGEDAGVWFREIEGHVHAIEKIIDRPMPLRVAGPCSSSDPDDPARFCGVMLQAKSDAIEVECPRCRTTHNIEKLRAFTLNRIDRRRFTATRLREIFELYYGDPISRQTVNTWIKDGRLKPRGFKRPGDGDQVGLTRRSEADEPVYRFSEARKLRLANGRKCRVAQVK